MNALHNLSHKKSQKVAAATSGPISEQRWFTLCITMEAERRIAKQYKCRYCCICKNYRGKVMKDGKKASITAWKKCVLGGHPIA